LGPYFRAGPAAFALAQARSNDAVNHRQLGRPSARQSRAYYFFRAREPDTALELLAPNDESGPISISRIRALQLLRIKDVQSNLDEMHKEVVESTTRTRQKAI
jgi:hypothetical protein